MPGKPRRDVIFDRIFAENPAIALFWNKKSKLSEADKYLFALSVISGLLKRISSRNGEEGKALEESLSRLEQQFASDLRLDEIRDSPKALENVEAALTLTIPQLRQRLIEPTCLELADEAGRLQRTLPSKNEITKRQAWAASNGIASDDAPGNDSEIIEQVLARKYSISESRVHKILAAASKFLR
jgi:hypothetical protein